MIKDLTVSQVADVLGLHEESVRRLCRQGSLPFMYRAGGQWRGSYAGLNKWKAAGGTRSVGRPAKERADV